MAPSLVRRQSCTYEEEQEGVCTLPDDSDGGFWWTSTGLAVRYAVVVGLVVLVGLFLIFAYMHARRRIRRGLPPLAYHRWLVSRRTNPNYGQGSRYAHYNPSAPAYGMNNYQPGPPAYNQFDAPPVYQPPEGGSKTLANQNIERVDGRMGEGSSSGDAQYAAPSHPPPAHYTQ